MTATYIQERQNSWCRNQIPLHSISGGKKQTKKKKSNRKMEQ